jgi:hypothetical protein
MRKNLFLVACLVILAALVSACSAEQKPTTTLDAAAIVQRFVDAGLPVDRVIVYDEETDPNSLLGRPKSYTGKVSFADTRISQYDDAETPEGGTVEVFANNVDAKSRYDYISSFDGSVLGTYQYLRDNVLVRISYDLTPAQAEEYDRALADALK